MNTKYIGSADMLARAPTVRSAISIEGIIAAYCVGSLCLQMMAPSLKVFSYGIPLLCLIALLASGRFSMPPNAPPYFVLIVAGLATAPLGTIKGLQDIWLMLMGLAPFCFGYKYKIGWRVCFIVTIIIAVVSVGMAITDSRFTGLQFDALNSVSSFESSTSFIFGVLAVWALLEKRWGRFLLAFVFTVLTLKRIAVLGVFVVLIVSLLPRRLIDFLLRPLPMIVLNVIFIVISITYAQGGFDNWIQKTSGQSPDQFGLGRQKLYAPPVQVLTAKPLQFVFYGVGAGGIYDVMKSHGDFFVGHRNLHNDSLKILVEYGGIVWILVFWTLYRHKLFVVRAMMLFTNVLWLTDNTLIYQFVIFPTALALTALVVANKDSEKESLTRQGPRRIDQGSFA